jgi:hypothetical protein
MAAELSALVGFAVVQPVLGPFGESPQTFVALGASSGDIVRFAVAVAVVPLVVLAVLAASTRALGLRTRSLVQTALVAGLAGFAATVVARHLGAGVVLRVVGSLAVAAGAAVLHRRWEPGRLFLRFASPTPVLLVALFLLTSPVAPLVRSPAVDVAAAESNDRPPVLLIVLDELPTVSLMDGDGGVDAGLFPNVARLADTSTWYRNNTSVASRTAVSLPSIVTGVLPTSAEQRAAVHAEYPDNLMTALASTHEVHAVEWATELCPRSVCSSESPQLDDEATALLDAPIGDRDPFADLLEEAGGLWWGQAWPTATPSGSDYAVAGASEVDELVEPGLEFLSGLVAGRGDRPTFDYLHAPVPHQPWQLLPSGGDHNGPHPAAGAELTGWSDDDDGEQLALAARSLHLLQMQWTDRMLGAIFDRMEELGRWDDAVVVLTADHGVSFERGQGLRTLSGGNQDDVYWVPLFVKAPHQSTAAVDDGNVLTVDIAPTIADLVGVELPWEADGISLVDDERADATKPARISGDDRIAGQPQDRVVELDADGLASILRAGGEFTDGPAELRPWRHGRHGDLLGRSVDELGVCGSGPRVDYEPPASWQAYVNGTLDRSAEPLPLWHEAVLDVEESTDVAAAMGGRVVSWAVARPTESEFTAGLLLAEPLVEGVDEVPKLYEVVDRDGCALSPLEP